ncbi:MAG: hypothetical protein JXR48_02795 [Candidatus Delongbacteria bacterium]|nr:hypothetical protein [Candidatus Delongbacteria bacterium]MBN2833875.1 hypothetical protein [Candidatus Delongbacteria bacterium]
MNRLLDNKGLGLVAMILIASITYIGSLVLFTYAIKKFSPPVVIEQPVDLDSLAAYYLLNLDSLRNDEDFMRGIRERITEEDIKEALSNVDDNEILNDLGVNIPGVVFTVTDSLRMNYAMADLLESELMEYINENEMTLQLKKEKVELQRKLDSLHAQLDTVNVASDSLRIINSEKENAITQLEEQNKELQKSEEEMNTADIVALAKKYDSMKPRKAAQILNGMDESDVVKILKKMKTRQAAKVMTELPPVKASQLSILMMSETVDNQ